MATETYQTSTEAVCLVAFIVVWAAFWLVLLTNYRGWLDRYAEFSARGWWAKRMTGWNADRCRRWYRFGAVIGLALAAFIFVGEGIGIANGRIG